MKTSKHLILWAILVLLFIPGCAVLEKAWLVPEEDVQLSYSSLLTSQDVIDVLKDVLKELHSPTKWWNYKVSYVNIDEGILETGNFSESNVVGIRLKARIKPDKHIIKITLKGAGPYYSKLPVNDALNTFVSTFSKKLAERAQSKSGNKSISTPREPSQ